MPTAADFDREREELKTLLASGVFNRAPNLANLLNYVCAKYFEGKAEEIKEYNVAVEALGRPSNFDQKKDSIVRVEANRLRKRLREYYENEGARHPVQIEIPVGQYVPKFVSREPIETTNGHVEEAIATTAPAPQAPPAHSPKAWRLWAIAVLLIAMAAWTISVGREIWRQKSVAAAKSSTAPITEGADELRILAGVESGNLVDPADHTWLADRYYRGGTASRTVNHRIVGATDPLLYQSRREGTFSYDIPLKPGVYELRLHFAETLYGSGNLAGGGETSRVFSVLANGQPLLRDFDVIADAGAGTADIKVFKDVSPASDGVLHLKFEPINNLAFLTAIEISPGIPGRMKPIYLVAREREYTDKNGVHWLPDSFVRGGQLLLRNEVAVRAEDQGLYLGERYGNLTYVIPVPQGRYAVTLHFAETWWGPNKPAGGGVGSRLFDILCNGVALVRNFDLYKEAGGSDRPLTRTFHNLEPSAQGKLTISMIPSRNYACINALEVVDESK
jgi:Malectin domain